MANPKEVYPGRMLREEREDMAILLRRHGKKSLSTRLKEYVKGSNNYSRMGKRKKSRRQKANAERKVEAHQNRARNKTKHV